MKKKYRLSGTQGGGSVVFDGLHYIFVSPATGFIRGDGMPVEWSIAGSFDATEEESEWILENVHFYKSKSEHDFLLWQSLID